MPPDDFPREEPGTTPRSERDLALLLSQSMGLEKALECVAEAVRGLGLSPGSLTRAEALRVLEHLADQPGIVGVTARFAKSRVHLKWSLRPPGV